jgi:DNA-binding GntR family transcriptional regulator
MDLSRILAAIERGDRQAADELLPLVYAELRELAARAMSQERPGATLLRQPSCTRRTCA